MSTETIRSGGSLHYRLFVTAVLATLASFGFLAARHPDWILSDDMQRQLGLDSSPSPNPVTRGSLAPSEFQPQTPPEDLTAGMGPGSNFDNFQRIVKGALLESDSDLTAISTIADASGAIESGCYQATLKEIRDLQEELQYMRSQVNEAALFGADSGNAEAMKFREHTNSVVERLGVRVRHLALIANGQIVCA